MTIGTLVAQRDEALKRGDTARADELDRDPQVRQGRAAWMHDRTGKENVRTLLAKEIDARNDARELERAALSDELRTIQQQIEQLQEFIRRGGEKVKETVKELVRGPQPDPADTSAEPSKPAPEPQRGGDRGDDDTWIPGQGFLGR